MTTLTHLFVAVVVSLFGPLDRQEIEQTSPTAVIEGECESRSGDGGQLMIEENYFSLPNLPL